MAEGSCMCGEVKYSFTGEPGATLLCHCLDCRHISGSTHSLNLLVGDDVFKVTGTPKKWVKTADSGKEITSFFCGNCGSTLYRTTGSFPNMSIIKGGSLNSGHDKYKPTIELYASERVAWQPEIQGAEQRKGME